MKYYKKLQVLRKISDKKCESEVKIEKKLEAYWAEAMPKKLVRTSSLPTKQSCSKIYPQALKEK